MPSSPPATAKLPFRGQTQKEFYWCWAAVCASLHDYFFTSLPSLEQCRFAGTMLGRVCCPNLDECDVMQSLEAALQAVGHFGSRYDGPITALPGGFLAIKQQIGVDNQPVVVRIELPDGGEHAVVVYGYSSDGSLVIWDPSGQYVHTNIEDFPTDLGDWLNSYFTQSGIAEDC